MKSVLILVISIFTLSLQAQSFEPGLWATTQSLNLNGIPLPSSKNQDCITASQAKDAKATIEKELKRKSCVLNSWVVKNQNLNAKVTCKSDDLDAVGTLQGAFSRKSYNLTGEIAGQYKGALPANATIKLTGQWTKKCPQ